MSKAYTHLSGFYNWIMEHVDYEEWSQHVQNIWEKHNLKPKNMLELASGTCSFSSQDLFSKFSNIVCSDLAYSMLKGYAGQGQKIRGLVQSDAQFSPFKKNSFDLCIMMYDSINYLLEEEHVGQCFSEIYNLLEKGGAFIFDSTTEYNSLTFFEDEVSVEENDEATVIRESWYDSKNQIQYNEFNFFVKTENNLYSRKKETHVQRIYSNSQMEELIKNSPFKSWARYADYGFEEISKSSERIHYILMK